MSYSVQLHSNLNVQGLNLVVIYLATHCDSVYPSNKGNFNNVKVIKAEFHTNPFQAEIIINSLEGQFHRN